MLRQNRHRRQRDRIGFTPFTHHRRGAEQDMPDDFNAVRRYQRQDNPIMIA